MKKVKNANGTAILRDDYDISLQNVSRVRFVVDKNTNAFAISFYVSEPGEGPEIIQISIGYGEGNRFIEGHTYKSNLWTSLGKAFLS